MKLYIDCPTSRPYSIQNNFTDEQYSDMIYVTANGNLGYLDANFCDRIRLIDPESVRTAGTTK